MFAENLKKYRKKKKLTQTDLADRLSNLLNRTFTYQNIKSYEYGTNPQIEVIVALAEALDIPVQFLFDDSKEPIKKIVKNDFGNVNINEDAVLKIPLLDGYIGAGSTGVIETCDILNHVYIDSNLVKKEFRENEITAIKIIGDSMKPYLNENDLVLFSKMDQYHRGHDGKYVIKTDSGLMVKNLKFNINGDIIISSENKSYPDEKVNKNSQQFLEIVGIVVGRILKN